MAYVRMLVQECTPGTIETLTDKAEETLVPRLRQMRGFLSYQIVKVDDHTLLAIADFATREGAEEMERIGLEWRKRYGKDAIVSSRPYIGQVILEAAGSATEAQPTL